MWDVTKNTIKSGQKREQANVGIPRQGSRHRGEEAENSDKGAAQLTHSAILGEETRVDDLVTFVAPQFQAEDQTSVHCGQVLQPLLWRENPTAEVRSWN